MPHLDVMHLVLGFFERDVETPLRRHGVAVDARKPPIDKALPYELADIHAHNYPLKPIC